MERSAVLTKKPAGMPAFVIVWIGQIISILASNMSHFAFTIWVFKKTGSATTLGLMSPPWPHQGGAASGG